MQLSRLRELLDADDGVHILPELLGLVVIALGLGEYVDNNASVIEQQPSGVCLPLLAVRLYSLFPEGMVYLFVNGFELPLGVCATDNEVVGKAADRLCITASFAPMPSLSSSPPTSPTASA